MEKKQRMKREREGGQRGKDQKTAVSYKQENRNHRRERSPCQILFRDQVK